MNRNISHLFILTGLLLFISISFIFYNFIGPIVLGIFIYYCTRPFYKKMIEEDINKTVSAIIAPLLFIIPVFILIIYTLRIVFIELRGIIIQTGDSLLGSETNEYILQLINESEFELLPELNTLLDLQYITITNIIQNINTNTFESILDNAMKIGISSVSSLTELFFTFLIAFSLSFYLLKEGHKIRDLILKHTNYDDTITEFTTVIDSDLKIVFFGNILLALLTGLIGAISFTLLTIIIPGGNILTYPALIGILCGLTSLIPVVGMKLVYIPVTSIITAIGVIENGLSGLLFPVIFFIVALIIVDTIPDFVARPYISSRGGISTGIIFFSYIFGPLTFGWYGLFLGPLIFVIAYEYVLIVLPKLSINYSY